MDDPTDTVDPVRLAHAQRESRMLEHPAQSQACDDIASLLDDVRRCYVPAQYRSVQQRLGGYIDHVDQQASAAKEERETADDRMRRMKRNGAIDDTVLQELTRMRDDAEFRRALFLRLGRQYRTVGDAIAWQINNFRSIAIYALGMNMSPGPTGGKAGSAAEADAVEDLWHEQNAFALRHDYTNVLRIWDLSVFSLDKPLWIAEVKASSNQRIGRKQKQLAYTAVALIHQRVTTGRDGHVLFHKVSDAIEPHNGVDTNLQIVVDAIVRSDADGIGTATNSYLAVTAVNMRHPKLHPPDAQTRARLRQIENEIPAEIQQPLCMDWLVADSMIKTEKPHYGVPYSVYPLPPYYAAMLVTGYLRLLMRFNTAALTSAFHAAGFDAQCLLSTNGMPNWDRGSDAPFYVLKRNGNVIKVGSLPIEQILFEGLPIEALVAWINGQERDVITRGGIVLPRRTIQHVLTTSPWMEDIWRSSREYTHEAVTTQESE